MNKYQESLNELWRKLDLYITKDENAEEYDDYYYYELKQELQELVDKETPMKPNGDKKENEYV